MKLTEQQKVARKAVRTRKARQTTEKKYGSFATTVIKYVLEGKSNTQIALLCYSWPTETSAIRAHVTRGTYNKYLKGCNFGQKGCKPKGKKPKK